MSCRGETICTGISFGSALAMVIKSGWSHTLHPETCREPLGLETCRRAHVESLGAERPPGRPTRRIIKRVPKELVKVDSEDLSCGPTNMPQMSGEK